MAGARQFAIGAAVLVYGLLGWISPATSEPATGADADAVARGRYVFYAGACGSCHTERGQPFLAGGPRIPTHLGTFYVPNITPDPETGLGRWTFADFRTAMVDGVAPDGRQYYPTFPYPWYTGMSSQDLADLWAYLGSVAPVRRQAQAHELRFPLNFRPLIKVWKLFNFRRGETISNLDLSPAWNRGAYIVNHLGHCGACHTPKDYFFNFASWRPLAGAGTIPGPYPAPNITPHPDGIGAWSQEDVVRALRRSMRPDGLPLRGAMAEYVYAGSGFLAHEDLVAVAEYLATIPPLEDELREGENRSDERLAAAPAQDGGSAGDPAGIGSSGSALLMLPSAGRTRPK